MSQNRSSVVIDLLASGQFTVLDLAIAVVAASDEAREDQVQPKKDAATRLLLLTMAHLVDVKGIDNSDSIHDVYDDLMAECNAKAPVDGSRNRFTNGRDMQVGGPVNISGMGRSLVAGVQAALSDGVDPARDAGVRLMVHHMAHVAATNAIDATVARELLRVCEVEAGPFSVIWPDATGYEQKTSLDLQEAVEWRDKAIAAGISGAYLVDGEWNVILTRMPPVTPAAASRVDGIPSSTRKRVVTVITFDDPDNLVTDLSSMATEVEVALMNSGFRSTGRPHLDVTCYETAALAAEDERDRAGDFGTLASTIPLDDEEELATDAPRAG